MITYLLKSTTCLVLFIVFYRAFLQHEKMHSFNRFYLLGSILFSFTIPFFQITMETSVTTNTSEVFNLNFIQTTNEAAPYKEYVTYLIIAYSTVTVLLLSRFSKNIISLLQKTRRNENVSLGKAKLVLVEDVITPYTFLNYIFLNKQQFYSNEIEEELLAHELAHSTQKHSIDILILEFLLAIFWFNPALYISKKHIQLNHEFAADDQVIQTYKNTSEYQHLLLSKSAWNPQYYLASNFNYYSLTKKRLVMMTTKSSKSNILLKKIAVLPLLGGFTFLFAESVSAQQSTTGDAPVSVQVKNNCENSNEKATVSFTYQDGKTITKETSKLTIQEKKQLPPPPPAVSESPFLPPPPLKAEGVNEKSNLSNITYYLDNKPIKKSKLDKMDPSTIASVNVKKNSDGTGSVYIISK